jgi:hypothetical protein
MVASRFRRWALVSILAVVGLVSRLPASAGDSLPVPMIPYSPRHYVCYRAGEALVIDGRLDEPSWRKAASTEPFVDIEGDVKPLPRYITRARMLWDAEYLYVGAELSEPDVWATLTQRDAVIYHDNDFEVFIDPDGDTHEYYELELNALNTVWDLLLIKPYRDGGPAVNAWNILGLKTAVAIKGTLNRPGDVDSGWSVEIAIPWTVLAECAHRPSPPHDGDQWRINFSRVEWQTETKYGHYSKIIDPATGRSLPEANWVWSPQGLIAMHYPEMWGIVQFADAVVGTAETSYIVDPTELVRWALRQVYYAESNYHLKNGTYTSDWPALGLNIRVAGFTWPPNIEATADLFQATVTGDDGTAILGITQDGRLWRKTR